MPIFDGKIYDLDKGTILDLFIRQQLIDRGLITFPRPRSRYRLVEPVSLTDEFDAWIFDHFHGLMDFWLTIDSTNKTNFPEKWKLSPTAHIQYTFVEQLISPDNDQIKKHIEHPSTKSLDSFIRDVCHIEDNGLADKWLEVLTKEENISTYAHLANLNQQEWERIDDLPMNALKTIKFYVDREKQTAEKRKKKKTVDPNESKKGNIHLGYNNILLFVIFLGRDDSYSKSELRANLHMIKLYFVRQLEDQDGIPVLPRLDKYCVKKAFEEMREEGYEDDGLFDDMKLFFQPLTVTEDELTIDSALLTNIRKNELAKKKDLEKNIEDFNTELETKKGELETEKKNFETEKQRAEKIIEESEKSRSEDLLKQIEQDREWAEKNEVCTKNQRMHRKNIKRIENEIKQIETSIVNFQTSLDEVNTNLVSNKTKIDQRLIKPHRGFIMYGPPGKEVIGLL